MPGLRAPKRAEQTGGYRAKRRAYAPPAEQGPSHRPGVLAPGAPIATVVMRRRRLWCEGRVTTVAERPSVSGLYLSGVP